MPALLNFTNPMFSINEGVPIATIHVSLDQPSPIPISVDYSIIGGTASSGLDYLPTSGTLQFAPNQTSQSFTVAILEDGLHEADETITFALSHPINAVLGPQPLTTLTILDNDEPPSVYFSAGLYSTIESSGGMTINVTLNTASGQVVTVNYATSDITATAGVDYTSASGTLTYQPGETSKTFWIAVNNDTLDEPNETVLLTLSNAVNANLGLLDTATFQINDDDEAFLSPGPQNHSEGDVVELHAGQPGSAGIILYGQSGLPQGLNIDALTGVISGTIGYHAAQFQSGSYTVTLTATAQNGDEETTTFSWQIADTNSTPTLLLPDSLHTAAGDGVTLLTHAADADGDSLIFSATGLPGGVTIDTRTGIINGVVAVTAASASPYLATISVTDGVQTTSHTITWTVTHLLMSSPWDQTSLVGDEVLLSVEATDPNGDDLTFSATGLPAGLSINTNTGLITGTVSATAANGTPHEVIVSATDGTNTASVIFTWTVPHLAIGDPGWQSSEEGEEVELTIGADDADNGTLTFSATGLPPGLSIDSATGVISGTTAALSANGGPYVVTVTVSDGTHTANTSFGWEVVHLLVAYPSEQIHAPGAVVSLQILAFDPDDDPLTYSAEDLPDGLSIDSDTGLISGTVAVSAGEDSPYESTVMVSDGSHEVSVTFRWFVSNGAVTITSPGAQTGTEGQDVSLQIEALTPPGASLSYRATGLPQGLSINVASGEITGEVAETAAAVPNGEYLVTVFADDGDGHSGSVTFLWTISAHNVAPEFLILPMDRSGTVGDEVAFHAWASDADEDELIYTAVGLPDGVVIDDETGLISGTIAVTADDDSPYTVEVTASDGSLSVSTSFLWVIGNGEIEITWPEDQLAEEGDVVQLSLTVSGGSERTFTAWNLPPGLSIDADTGEISGTLSATASQDGYHVYSVVVSVSDENGLTGSTSFDWVVTRPQAAPTLTDPGHQTSDEGDEVELQIVASDVNDDDLTYTAIGLPAGLGIDRDTGLISGRLSRFSGGTDEEEYTVWVTVNDGHGHSASQSFTWTVNNENVSPWLAHPGLQVSAMDEAVSVSLQAVDYERDVLTFSAVGLPTGLTINPVTGLITGAATTAGSYTVTLGVADGDDTTSETISWTVLEEETAHIILKVNGTLDHTDDLALLNPATPIPVEVTLVGATPGWHLVEVSVLPSLSGMLDYTQFSLTNGGTRTLWYTPLQFSQLEDDITIQVKVDGDVKAEDKLTNADLKIPEHIRAANTPEKMPDRIPPRARTPFSIETSVALKGKRVYLVVKGQSNDNGTMMFIADNGQRCYCDWLEGPGVYKFEMVGLSQTTATVDGKGGNAGKLSLGLEIGGKLVRQSAGFSVAAIPMNWSVKFKDDYKADPSKRGMVVEDSWKSDSGDLADLDQVQIAEVVQIQSKTGVFANVNNNTSGYFPAIKSTTDRHAIDKDGIKADGGTLILDQLSVFKDARTGASEITVSNSGYRLVYRVYFSKDAKVWKFGILKIGAEVTIKDGEIKFKDGDDTKTIPIPNATSKSGEVVPKEGVEGGPYLN